MYPLPKHIYEKEVILSADHAVLQPVDVRRTELPLPITAKITISRIIGQEVDDGGLLPVYIAFLLPVSAG
ncbi:MAG TPA: hypothetical protein VE870_14295 [Bacteroidales bacterium]|nr:hypothetical protein [Bacteroidales bacterium]